MRVLMILPTAAAGAHHALYGLAVARAARDRHWQVDLATPIFQLDHPAGIDLKSVVASTGGELVDIPSVALKWTGLFGYLEGQFRRWALVREAEQRAGSARQHDVAYVDLGDGWYVPCCVLGMPLKKVPAVAMMLRLRYHHGLLAFGAAYRVRMASLQRVVFERFLRCRLLQAVLTPDRPLIEHCSLAWGKYKDKVQYVPDLGQSIALTDRIEARNAFGIGEGKRVIVCVGGINDRKGIRELIAGLANASCHESVMALLVGPVHPKLSIWLRSPVAAALIASKRLWIEDGIYDAPGLGRALSAADGVWLGYRDHMGSSSVLWEAVQAGIPILGCHSGLIAWEILSNDIGETVNIDDSRAVACALTRVLCDQEARERWRRNGRQNAALHTPSAFGESVADVLEKCSQARAGAGGCPEQDPTSTIMQDRPSVDARYGQAFPGVRIG
jgi:glycosyltransferase involved in cell wall biosynthesis